MKTLKKVLHMILLAILILLAASGILAIFLPIARERHVDKEVTIARVDKKDEGEMKDQE
jgi:hypothetical protein